MIWISMWVFIILFWCVVFYLVLAWATTSGSVVVNAWATQLSLSLIQDALISEVVKVYVLNVLILEVMRPQLRQISNVLSSIALGKICKKKENENDIDYMEQLQKINVVQHMSAVCRCARMKSAVDLPASQLMMHIDDHDIMLCRELRTMSLGWIPLALAIIPTVLAFSNEVIQEVALSTIIPMFWNLFLVLNALLLYSSPLTLAIPYLIVVGLLLYWYCVRKPARHRHICHAHTTGADTTVLKGWRGMKKNNEYRRKRRWWTSLSSWRSILAFDWLVHRVEKMSQLAVHSDIIWRNMNLMTQLHGKISRVAYEDGDVDALITSKVVSPSEDVLKYANKRRFSGNANSFRSDSKSAPSPSPDGFFTFESGSPLAAPNAAEFPDESAFAEEYNDDVFVEKRYLPSTNSEVTLCTDVTSSLTRSSRRGSGGNISVDSRKRVSTRSYRASVPRRLDKSDETLTPQENLAHQLESWTAGSSRQSLTLRSSHRMSSRVSAMISTVAPSNTATENDGQNIRNEKIVHPLPSARSSVDPDSNRKSMAVSSWRGERRIVQADDFFLLAQSIFIRLDTDENGILSTETELFGLARWFLNLLRPGDIPTEDECQDMLDYLLPSMGIDNNSNSIPFAVFKTWFFQHCDDVGIEIHKVSKHTKFVSFTSSFGMASLKEEDESKDEEQSKEEDENMCEQQRGGPEKFEECKDAYVED